MPASASLSARGRSGSRGGPCCGVSPLLCNGVVLFEDTGVLLPGGQSIPPHRAAVTNVPAPPALAVAWRLTAHRAVS